MIKNWITTAKDYLRANFHSYFWYFAVFVAGIITAGLFTFLGK
jgi:hypothetical protein